MKKFLFFFVGLIVGVAIIYGVSLLINNTSATPTPQTTTQSVSVNKDIAVTNPLADAEISSPVFIEGSVRGTWFFEAIFFVRVFDDKDVELGNGTLQAVGNWMTANFVPFKGQITFNKSTSPKGYLLFQNSNPSGLKENSEEFKLPITFSQAQP